VVEATHTHSTTVTDLESARALIDELARQVELDQREIDKLRHQLAHLTKYVFGRRSEKGHDVPEQCVLPLASAAGKVEAAGEDEAAVQTEVKSHQRRKHPGRKALSKELPRQQVVLDVDPEQTHCGGCDQPKVRIGCDSTETLDYQPASLFIREYLRPKYACPRCQDAVVQQSMPLRPIEKGRPEPGLLAHVITSKYAYHLPLYRQEQIFSHQGVGITRSLMSEWNGAVADLLKPLAETIHGQILQSRYVQSDDTGIEVQGAEGYRNGHMWVYRGEDGEVSYDFSWQRNRDGPLKRLNGYKGYLQADAAPAFDEVYRQCPEIKEVGCWAHARRYFKEAQATSPLHASQVVVLIGELYGIERSIKHLDENERYAQRRQRAKPVLDRLNGYLREIGVQALPKSPLGQAITYVLNQWQALNRYLEHGALEIDNNGAERAIKPLVLGRKNWLFIGSEAAAHRTCVLLTLVNTCKALHINPFEYLRDVIERVSAHPMSRIAELTPREWKRLRKLAASAAA